MSDSGVDHPTAIVTAIVVGQHLRHRLRVPRRVVLQEALVETACRVFQPGCRRMQFLEAGERGVEVCLVEDFAAADQVAVDRQKFDLSPLGVEALLRGSVRRPG